MGVCVFCWLGGLRGDEKREKRRKVVKNQVIKRPKRQTFARVLGLVVVVIVEVKTVPNDRLR